MKRISICIITAFTGLFSACYKDTGNYDYKEINEVTISGIASSYTAIFGLDVLTIKPTITMTEGEADPNRFAYYWVLCRGYTPLDTLGEGPELNYPVSATPDAYNLFLRIKDKQTGVTWQKGTAFTIGTRFSTGLMLMGYAENGNAEVDMITMVNDTVVVRGLLSASGLPALTDPVTIVHNGDKDTSVNKGRVWVMTKSGSYYLERKSMKGNINNRFGRMAVINDPVDKDNLNPILYAPQFRDRAGSVSNSSNRAMMTSDGNIFSTNTFIAMGDYYSNAVNREEATYDKRLPTAPYLWYAIGTMPSIIWYDTENDRFMNYASFGINSYSVSLADKAGELFPWNQSGTGRKLVYGENTRNTDGGSTSGNSFAIMKDATNQCHIYKFWANGNAPVKRDYYTVKPIATDFDKASFYAFSSRRTVVFYAVGNRLYCYDYNKNLEKVYQFPELGGDEITMLKFDTQIDFNTNTLYIATYNPTTKGRLRRFTVGTDPNTVTITPVNRADWDGLVKIKDMNWRAFN
ncbi:PKD-like family lipoprotein [Chitinophaga horti]|uniref:PKD-like family lipoprotein n=1 Tax=Chitinophaga horti TaxID=2920382 RepID=A0ABY6J1Z9_9BACT|nr:PKD-like family lipoprotein [Chitinophaga horti]UYQ92662.1 PKD-like family lipoprotein [Chitinophaga horti]